MYSLQLQGVVLDARGAPPVQWLKDTKLDHNDPDHSELLELQKLLEAHAADVAGGRPSAAVICQDVASLKTAPRLRQDQRSRWRARWQIAAFGGGLEAFLAADTSVEPPHDALAVHGQQLMHALRIRWAILRDCAVATSTTRAELARAPADQCVPLQLVQISYK
jgi:hypothetical protein